MSTVTQPGIKTTEGTLTTSDGFKLYTKTWHPSTPILARLVFVHGFSDHCNCYGHFFNTLAKSGIKVYSYDQRGWGRSVHKSSQKGLTGPTSRIMQDLSDFIESLPPSEEEEEGNTSTPLFLMGHSMGGGEILYYASNAPSSAPASIRSKIHGYLAESPYIRVHPKETPWKATVIAGKVLGKVLPHFQMPRKLDPKSISRDRQVCEEWEGDALCHDTGTLEGLAAMIDRAKDLEEGKVVIRDGSPQEQQKTRIWIGFGSGDKVLDMEACKKWFEQRVDIEDKEFKIYEGWYHKLHAEPGEDKFKFAKDVGDWILARSSLSSRSNASVNEDSNAIAATTKSKL